MDYQKTFTGIGSRTTPLEIIEQMKDVSVLCYDHGYWLNSGGADGADTAFEEGMDSVNGNSNIFLPWPGFNGHKDTKFTRAKPEAHTIAATIHPVWNSLTHPVKSLIARNIHQVLGWSLKDPVDFVVCWTYDGCETQESYTIRTGGTGIAISLASSLGIPVFNLCNEGRLADLVRFVAYRDVNGE
jgi:hypothetical protein